MIYEVLAVVQLSIDVGKAVVLCHFGITHLSPRAVLTDMLFSTPPIL